MQRSVWVQPSYHALQVFLQLRVGSEDADCGTQWQCNKRVPRLRSSSSYKLRRDSRSTVWYYAHDSATTAIRQRRHGGREANARSWDVCRRVCGIVLCDNCGALAVDELQGMVNDAALA